jgi:hypothetical protein
MFRASILPYIINDGEVYIGLGLDSRYKEITDFGGRVDFYDKDHYSTAVREFQEETSSPIDLRSEGMVEVKNDNHQIYICQTERYVMNNYIQHISNIEVSRGFIVNWTNFLSLLDGKTYKGYKMWESLRLVLMSNLESIRSTLLSQDSQEKDKQDTCIPGYMS